MRFLSCGLRYYIYSGDKGKLYESNNILINHGEYFDYLEEMKQIMAIILQSLSKITTRKSIFNQIIIWLCICNVNIRSP